MYKTRGILLVKMISFLIALVSFVIIFEHLLANKKAQNICALKNQLLPNCIEVLKIS